MVFFQERTGGIRGIKPFGWCCYGKMINFGVTKKTSHALHYSIGDYFPLTVSFLFYSVLNEEVCHSSFIAASFIA